MTALVVVTLLWGFTFVWMKQATDCARSLLGEAGLPSAIGLFLTVRFLVASVVLGCVPQARRGLTSTAWRGGTWLGITLLAGFLLQMFGLTGVSPAVSAFLTSLYVLFTAAINTLRSRSLPPAPLAIGAVLATLGAAYIGGPPELTFDLGEWLTVGCAVVFALHILLTDTWTKRAAPMAVTWTSFVVVTLGAIATLALTFKFEGSPSTAGLLDLLMHADFWQPALLTSLLATVLALSLMNLFQRDLDPVRAAIIYALEPIWAATFGVVLGYDSPGVWLYLGGTALLVGNLVAEIGPILRRRNPTRE